MSDTFKSQKRLGSRIKELRKRRGFTQVGLAVRAGFSAKFVGQLEQGGNCTVAALIKVAAALDTDAGTLLSGDPVPMSGRRSMSAEEFEAARKATQKLHAIFGTRHR